MAWPNGTRYKVATVGGSWVPGDMNGFQDQVLQVAGYRGKKITAGAETRTNVAYGVLTTADEVTGITIPTDGIIVVRYRALWKNSCAGAEVSKAAIFVGSDQLKGIAANATVPVAVGVPLGPSAGYTLLYTDEDAAAASGGANYPCGLATGTAKGTDTTVVTTGQTLGGGPIEIDGLPAGTYTVGVRFLCEAGKVVTVKDRKLLVGTKVFD